jgi:hypothetical protein
VAQTYSCDFFQTDTLVAKQKREEEKAKKENADRGISNYFTKGPVTAQPKAKVCGRRARSDASH